MYWVWTILLSVFECRQDCKLQLNQMVWKEDCCAEISSSEGPIIVQDQQSPELPDPVIEMASNFSRSAVAFTTGAARRSCG